MPVLPSAHQVIDRPAAPPLTSRELVWAGLFFLLLMLAITAVSGSIGLIVRFFWLDEIITYTLASDSSLPHMFAALLHGTDSNPPAYHLLLWSLHAIGMPLNEATLRLIAAGAILAAMLGLYASLRFMFSRIVSAAAVITLFAGQTVVLPGFELHGELLIRQMFEARFYGPWLAICAWFGYCQIALRVRPSSLPARIGLGAFAFFMLTIHYFGLFTFVLMVAADLLTDPRTWKQRIAARLPLLAAIPALAVVGTFYLHQSKAFTAKSWVDPPTFANSVQFLWEALAPFPLLILLGVVGIALLLRKRTKAPVADQRPTDSSMMYSGLISLAFLPLVVLLFSCLVQPASVGRYAFPAVGGTAIFAAFLLSRLPRVLVVLFACIFVLIGAFDVQSQAAEMYESPYELRAYMTHLTAVPPSESILFELRLDYYPAVMYYPALRPRMAILDFEHGEFPDSALAPSMNYAIVERDAQRAAAAFYPQFRSFPQSQLAHGSRFILIAADAIPKRIAARFGASNVRYIIGREFEITLPL